MWLPQEPRRWVRVPRMRRGQQEWRGGSLNTRQSSGRERERDLPGLGEGLGPLFL